MRRAMDFVQDHKLTLLRAQIVVSIFQAAPVCRLLKVEIQCLVCAPSGDGAGQGRFAHLSRPQQDHGGRALQRGAQLVVNFGALDHPAGNPISDVGFPVKFMPHHARLVS